MKCRGCKYFDRFRFDHSHEYTAYCRWHKSAIYFGWFKRYGCRKDKEKD